MSVNIQTKNGLIKIAENCHCENSDNVQVSEIAVKPVQLLADEAALGDYLQLHGYQAFSSDDIVTKPVELLADEIALGDYLQLHGYQAFSSGDVVALPIEDVSDLYKKEV